ncbi:hypothetical protein RHSIM_Rhsim08G0125200 [Rhododendron simsii]|uniref:BRO1 domain-containing protein n=1 Tax=Rhododendron simsii TaxID=118357 RepID=A0A834GGV1_RHOSS|nr:hypothetical protein RHSIM_Rhsim08G0125200 [Rhododendron simsii]
MGCLVSTPKDLGGNRRRPANVGEISIFVPGLRIPKPVDFSPSLTDHVSKTLVERLSALRTRIVVMAGQEGPTITRTKRKTQHGGSTLADLQQALEDYLPFLLGLVKDGSPLQHKVQFVWVNQEDDAEETAMSNAWYEVLSVLHLMASLSLSQANLLLLPRTSADGYQPKISEESRRTSIDVLLKAAGYLDCAVRQVLPLLPAELRSAYEGIVLKLISRYRILIIVTLVQGCSFYFFVDFRRGLPVDLTEGVLRALCLQALGQGVDIQLGLAIDSTKATLAVKRRLACEMVKYWQQAQDNLTNLPLSNGWGEKHRFFVKWKYIEAKLTTMHMSTPCQLIPGRHNQDSVLIDCSSTVVSAFQAALKASVSIIFSFLLSSQAAAYYYHGLILDEGNTEKSHGMAVAALQAADEFLKESKKMSDAFNTAPPLSRSNDRNENYKYSGLDLPLQATALSPLDQCCEYCSVPAGLMGKRYCNPLIPSRFQYQALPDDTGRDVVTGNFSRNPPLWGTMKYLSEKIPKDTSSKVRINQDLYSHDKIMETAPTLPDFALALKPDDYQLPPVHISWNEENVNRGQ